VHLFVGSLNLSFTVLGFIHIDKNLKLDLNKRMNNEQRA